MIPQKRPRSGSWVAASFGVLFVDASEEGIIAVE